MLRLERWLPAPLHIAGLRIAHKVRLRWWKITGRPVRGCRVIVFNPAGEVLLIRHSYGSGEWMLPGGGLAAGEDPLAGARREVAEEAGLVLSAMASLGRTDDPHSIHETWLVAGWATGEPRPDLREILAAGFYAPEALPDPVHEGVVLRLADWITAAQAVRPEGPDARPCPPPAPTG